MQQSRFDECLRDDGLVPSLIHGRDWEDLWDYFLGIFIAEQSAWRLTVGHNKSLTKG